MEQTKDEILVCPFYEEPNRCLLSIGPPPKSAKTAREHYQHYFKFPCPRFGGHGDCFQPIKNKEGNAKKEVELINGKFVVKGKKEEEVKAPEVKVEQKQYGVEVVALIDRVREGNDKLWNAWKQIREITNPEKKEEMLLKWDERKQFLNDLCRELVMKGFRDCLYIDKNGKKTKGCLYNPDNPEWFCNTCPAQLGGGPNYWEKELMNLPR